MTRQRGFTLLEVLVALSVFAFISVMSYTGLQAILQSRSQTQEQAERLAELQKAMLLVENDLRAATDRTVRDPTGQPVAAMQYQVGQLDMTRGGRPNPLNRRRSSLERLIYRVEDDNLVRIRWETLDQGYDPATRTTELLSGVTAVTLRFLTQDGEWQETWPPAGSTPTPGAAPGMQASTVLPRAIEVTLELEDWGTVTRMFSMVPIS